jgi:6-phosphogluconolactonase
MKTHTVFLALVYCALAAAVLNSDSASQAGEKPSSTGKTFAYISNFGSNAISAFQIDTSTGALLTVKGSPFKTGRGPEFLVSDNGQYLYVSNVSSNSISAFAINGRTGALTPVPGSPFPVGRQPKGIAVVPSANLLFVVNVRDNNVSSLRIDAATGALSPIAQFPAGFGAFEAAVTPAGAFLYLSDRLSGDVSGFAINSTSGDLTPVPNSPFKTGQTPIGLVASRSGAFLYVVDHMQVTKSNRPQDSFASYRIDPQSGSLTRVAGVLHPKVTCQSACHLNPLLFAIHPTRPFAYATDVGAGSISPYALRSSGTLSPLSPPIPAGKHPFGLALDSRGKFLYVVNKVDNTISGFAVNSTTGLLSPLQGSPFPAGGSEPKGIVIVSK